MRHVLAALLALLPAAALAQGNTTSGVSGTPAPSVLVTTETPHQGSLPRTLTAYGTVQAAPGGGSQTLSVLRTGQVTEVLVAPGHAVHRGQKLLVISAGPAALAAYKQAVDAVKLATSTRTHTAQLLAQHLATKDQLAQADKAAADAQSTLNALNQGGGEGGGGSAEQTLTAPSDGVVSNVAVAPGARIAAGTPLLTLARSGRFVASVGIEPAQRDLVTAGQSARVESLYGGGAEQGSVLSVGAMLDPTTRLVPVLIDPPQKDPSAGRQGGSDAGLGIGLLPGAPVRVVVQVGSMQGWIVPRDAVLTDAKGPYVFQVTGGKAVRVDVQIVGKSGNTTVITGALDLKHALVVSGNYQLQDGAAVREEPTTAGAGAATP